MRLILAAAMVSVALAQPLMINTESCLNELFDADAGKANVYARAYNAWAIYIKETVPGPSAQAQARYKEDLWKLTKDMDKKLDRLHSSRCYPDTK